MPTYKKIDIQNPAFCTVNQGIEISVSNPTSESHAGFIPLSSLNKIQAS